MSWLAGMRALRYTPERVGGLGAVLAPPYDVISAADAENLRRRHERNIVRLTNPQGSGEDRYGRAAEALRAWTSEGVLAQDERPAVYVHRHTFGFDGGERSRTGLWALVRLAPFGAGPILPHERTMRAPRADRLALMRACGAQLSPIFFICSDPAGDLAAELRGVLAEEPIERTEFPVDQAHELWRVDDPEALDALGRRVRERTLLIADGHHRYETALTYRDELIARGAPASGRQTHEFVLGYIVPESDPGLLLLPTHRVVQGERIDWRGVLARLADELEIRELAEGDTERAIDRLEAATGRPEFLLVVRGEPGGWHLRLRLSGAAEAIAAVVVQERLLERGVGLSREEAIGRLAYLRDAREALQRVRSGAAEAAALVAAPRVEQVRRAAAAGLRLPPKTTYFWPKVPTGIAVHAIDPVEEVRILGVG